MSAAATSDDAPARPSRWCGIVPALRWLRNYKPAWLRADLVAGFTLSAYLLPAGLGDASLANLPPEAGLYACLFGGLVFWLFCSSRHTTITVTSAISLLTGATLGGIAGGDPSRFSVLAAATAVLVALIGEVPEGLPTRVLRPLRLSDWGELLALAFACFLLAAVETAAIGRVFTAKHGGRLNANEGFLALCVANLAVGLGRGFPVSG